MRDYLDWVKSSHSGSNDNCVEVASLPGGRRAVRDSKDLSQPMIVFATSEWRTFIAGIRHTPPGPANTSLASSDCVE